MPARKTAPVIISNDQQEIKIYTTESHGRPLHQLSYYRGGKRERRSFADLNEAKREARIILGGLARDSIQAENLTAAEIESYTVARRILAPHNTPVHVAAEVFASARADLAPEVSIHDAVRYFNQFNRGVERKQVEELIEDFIASRRAQGVTETYLRMVRRYVVRFGKFTRARMLPDLRARDLDDFLQQETALAAITKNYARKHVMTFCRWAVGRGFLAQDWRECAVSRQMRDGHDPLSDVRMTPAEFAEALKRWRVKHGFTQREAGAAIGTSAETVRGWESQGGVPRQPALGEILRRLRMPVDVELVRQATKRPRPIEPEKFAELMGAWRRRCKLSRVGAAYALRAATGLKMTDRTIWVWETARALPQRPLAVLELIHGPLAVNPPKPKPLIAPKQFAKALRDWRRKHCLTQAQACVALGLPCDQALISNWESGKAFPRKPRMQQLVAALKEPPASGPGTHNWFKARSAEFGQKLRAWRKARGLCQLDACAVLHLPCDQGLICRYERGEASPRRERMVRILAMIAGTEVQP